VVARLLAVAMVGACAGALAQTVTQPEVTVRGLGTVHKEVIGRDINQVPMERVTVSRTVGYGDLNLNTNAGQYQLKKRIYDTASNLCRDLYSMYPSADWTSDRMACVQDAVRGAMNQLPAQVAAAEREAPIPR
jgi:UrcA family protein